uniref:Thiol:disulfide interchange protein (DsbC) fold, Reductase, OXIDOREDUCTASE.2A n=1 Tax=Podoviridae sp. ctLPy3 TaxID=2825244 RepID=A0A8S5UWF4_9CAUD|nr:MAG TPA: Thiol:disulfide interchange protein (DsbC) fold, Reductase, OXIDOREDUCTASE.2A [Caudoviricetes sp.]DAF98772.1 MAG TPA: Thiol:disulfide interchange protein (DsbC) fold, Reductase, OXIDOREDUCTASE.2A [Podoviridae sp. ctLPy3]
MHDNLDIKAKDSLCDYHVYHHLCGVILMVFSNLTIKNYYNIHICILLFVLLIIFYVIYLN